MHLAVIGPFPPGRRTHLAELQPTPALGGQMALIQQQRHRLRGPQHPVVHAAVQRDQPRPLAQPGRADRLQQCPHLGRIGDPAPVHRVIHLGRPPFPVRETVERICRKTALPHRVLQRGIEHPPPTPVVLRGCRRPVKSGSAALRRWPGASAGLRPWGGPGRRAPGRPEQVAVDQPGSPGTQPVLDTPCSSPGSVSSSRAISGRKAAQGSGG